MPRRATDASWRKLRCDERLPVCLRCEKRGLDCDRSSHLIFKHFNHQDKDGEHNETNSDVYDDDFTPPSKLLEQPHIARLFQVFIRELAPWYDLNDSQNTFSTYAVQAALENRLLFSAIIAFAGIFGCRKYSSQAELADAFHHRCLRLLIDLKSDDPAIEDGTALAATCLLRSYELLAEDVDPNRHLYGASTLVPWPLPSLSVQEIKPPLLAAGFWNYLREDITYSLIHECPLKLDLDFSSCKAGSSSDRSDAVDEAAALITLMLGRTINWYFRPEKNDSSEAESIVLFNDIRSWQSLTKSWLKPYSKVPPKGPRPFPSIYMQSPCHAATMHYYLVAQAMLSEVEHQDRHADFKEKRIEQALQIVGIAMTFDIDPVVVNAYGPITFVGQWLDEPQQRESLIMWLESSTSKTAWNVKDLIVRLRGKWTNMNE